MRGEKKLERGKKRERERERELVYGLRYGKPIPITFAQFAGSCVASALALACTERDGVQTAHSLPATPTARPQRGVSRPRHAPHTPEKKETIAPPSRPRPCVPSRGGHVDSRLWPAHRRRRADASRALLPRRLAPLGFLPGSPQRSRRPRVDDNMPHRRRALLSRRRGAGSSGDALR